MKKLALISTFCNTEEKQNLLRNTINALKNEGVDVMCLSPASIHLPLDIIKKSDFVFFTKENPILRWPVRAFTQWRTILTKEGWVKLEVFQDDYGWADLYQRKKLMEMGLTFDYDIFYNLIYDTEISKELIQEIKNNEFNYVHPVIKPYTDTVYPSSLQFMVLDRELTKKILKENTLENYRKYSQQGAEDIVVHWQRKFNIPTKGTPVQELNYIHQDVNFWDYNLHNDYEFFVNKTEKHGDDNGKLKILFHNINSNGKIIIKVNDLEHVDTLVKDENRLIELNIECNKVNKFNISFNEKNYDFTKKYLSINKNYIAFI